MICRGCKNENAYRVRTTWDLTWIPWINVTGAVALRPFPFTTAMCRQGGCTLKGFRTLTIPNRSEVTSVPTKRRKRTTSKNTICKKQETGKTARTITTRSRPGTRGNHSGGNNHAK